MLFAPIVPLSMMEQIKNHQYHMILAQHLKNEEYYHFYSLVEGFKILDNGAAEGIHTHTEDLLRAAYALQVDEVVAPDVLGHAADTLYNLKVFMSSAVGYSVMAVCQCETWDDFAMVVDGALNAGVASLALPRLMASRLGEYARLEAAMRIRTISDIPIHALGCTNNLKEVRELNKQGIVRGIDSSAPVVLGLHDLTCSYEYGPGVRQSDFFSREGNIQATRNLETFTEWCIE